MNNLIGILTMYDSNNYGASLQALATVEYLRSKGKNAEIIRYKNKEEKNGLRICYKEEGKISGYLKSFAKNVFFGRYFFYKHAFKNFKNQKIFSENKIDDVNTLQKSKYSLVIAGSDQIWNPEITGGIDDVFLMNFEAKFKKISFATSIGSYNLSDEDKTVFSESLTRYEAISVREEVAKEQLQNIIDKDIRVVLDPTFLLSGNEWRKKASDESSIFKKNRGKYILTYFISSKKTDYKNAVIEYSRYLNLPVWAIQYSNYTWKENDKKLLGLSLEEFIDAVDNAYVVLTDSFHGTAISINLNKNFVALNNSTNPIRVKSLLQKLEIGERLNMKPNDYQEINYYKVEKILSKYIAETKKWLDNNTALY